MMVRKDTHLEFFTCQWTHLSVPIHPRYLKSVARSWALLSTLKVRIRYITTIMMYCNSFVCTTFLCRLSHNKTTTLSGKLQTEISEKKIVFSLLANEYCSSTVHLSAQVFHFLKHLYLLCIIHSSPWSILIMFAVSSVFLPGFPILFLLLIYLHHTTVGSWGHKCPYYSHFTWSLLEKTKQIRLLLAI